MPADPRGGTGDDGDLTLELKPLLFHCSLLPDWCVGTIAIPST